MVLLGLSGTVGTIVNNLGFAFIVTGIVNLFRELAIIRLEVEESRDSIAKAVHQKIISSLDTSVGLKLAAPIRRGYDGYYTWITKTQSQTIFLAGRSVLHRIQYDLQRRELGSCEEALLRKLKEGSEIRLLFLDPRSDLIDRLAMEEDREPEALLNNLSDSLSIVNRLYNLTINKHFHNSAQLFVRLYDKVPYFAYHQVNEDVLIGFYFATSLVQTSSVYTVIDENSKRHFGDYFASIFTSAKPLFELSARTPSVWFNENLNEEIKSHLVRRLKGKTHSE